MSSIRGKYVGFLALPLLVSLSASAQKVVTQHPVFHTSGQSMWGDGDAPGLNMNFEIFPEYKVDLPFNTASFTKLSFSGLDFGAVLDGRVAFGVGPFEFDISGFTSGEIDVNYPAEVTLGMPDDNTFNPGETIVIQSAFEAEPGATLSTHYPQAGSIGLYMGLMFDADFGFSACFIDCTPRIPIIPPPFPPMPKPLYDDRFAFFKVSAEEVTFICDNSMNFPLEHPFQCSLSTGGPPWTVSHGAFSGELDIPNVTTTSSLAGNNLVASGADPYVTPAVNIIELLGYIPPIKAATSIIQGEYTQDIAPDVTGTMRGITIEWALAAIDLNLPIRQSQAFEFRPRIYTTLKFPDTVDYVVHSRTVGNIPGRGVAIDYEAGDSISVRFPCNYDFMDVYATHRIGNRFSNKTFDNISLELDFAVMDFGLTIDPYTIIPRICIPIPFTSDLCIGPVGFPGASFDPPPLYDPDPLTLVSQDFPAYFEDEWELGGFNTVDIAQPFRLKPREREVTFALQHVTCNGASTGSIVTTAAESSTPLQYEWSFGSTQANPTNVPAGRHYLKLTDANGCESIESIEILEPPPIDVAIDPGTIACAQGGTEIQATASGGTGPFNYSWSSGETTPSLTGKPAGTYYLTVTDAAGCSATDSVTLHQPNPLAVAVSEQKDVSCAGADDGQARLFVQGGTAPYLYTWSNGSSVRDQEHLAPGYYAVNVTDAQGCTASADITLSEPAPLEASLAPPVHVSCYGGNDGALQTMVLGGTPPYRYRWYDSLITLSETGPAIAGLERGIYSVEVTDTRGCQRILKTRIAQPELPLQADIEAIAGACHAQASGALDLHVRGGTPPYAYQWTGGWTSEDLFNVPAGEYRVTVTDAQGCQYSNKTLLPDPPRIRVGLARKHVSCIDARDGEIAITSIEGGLPPYAISWSTGETTETIGDLEEGTYFVTIEDAAGCETTEVREVAGSDADCLFIPNAFSPNGDGTNDHWNIRQLDLYPGAVVKVFNKWGVLVFESTGYSEPWDGTRNGKLVEPATYYYLVDLRNGEPVYQGFLMVLR